MLSAEYNPFAEDILCFSQLIISREFFFCIGRFHKINIEVTEDNDWSLEVDRNNNYIKVQMRPNTTVKIKV